MDIANVLKEFRSEHGLSQEQLADLLGTSQQTIGNWESGTQPRGTALKRINHLLATYQDGDPPTPTNFSERNHTMAALADIGVKPRSSHGFPPGYVVNVIGRPLDAAPSFSSREFLVETLEHLEGRVAAKTDVKLDYMGVRQRIDYLTEKVCAEVKLYRQGPSPIADLGIYQLSTIRQIHKINREERLIYALILVTPDEPGQLSIPQLLPPRINAAGALHGIMVIGTSSPEQCARTLAELEDVGKSEEELIEGY